MGEGSGKCSSFKLCFNLNDNQLKSSRYSYRSTYMNLKVTKNPQQIHTQKKKNREKRAQAHHQRKSSNHKGRNQKKERTEKNDKNREQVTK